MGRERFEDLKEAYALGALAEEERREMEGYLTLHPELRSEVEELGSLANTLAFSVPEHEPSAEVRRNLMRIVDSESSVEQAAAPPILQRLRGYLTLRVLAPATLAIITVALLGWNVLLQGEIQDLQGQLQERRTFAMEGTGAASETDARIVELASDEAIVMADGMPVPPEGKTMQIWVIQDGTPQPAGTFQPGGDTVAVPISNSLNEGDTVAITLEPAGGSDQPTSEPVLQADIET